MQTPSPQHKMCVGRSCRRRKAFSQMRVSSEGASGRWNGKPAGERSRDVLEGAQTTASGLTSSTPLWSTRLGIHPLAAPAPTDAHIVSSLLVCTRPSCVRMVLPPANIGLFIFLPRGPPGGPVRIRRAMSVARAFWAPEPSWHRKKERNRNCSGK